MRGTSDANAFEYGRIAIQIKLRPGGATWRSARRWLVGDRCCAGAQVRAFTAGRCCTGCCTGCCTNLQKRRGAAHF